LKTILIIDPCEEERLALAAFLRKEGYNIDEASTDVEAMKLMEVNPYDLVITDLCEPDCMCAGILHWIKTQHPWINVIVATSFGSIDCVVKTIRMGARNYVMKPVTNKAFLDIVQEATHIQEQEIKSLRRVNEPYCYRVDTVVGVSKSMENVLQAALKVTDLDTGILIRGESGTGKELVARTLHRSSPRRQGPLVTINCAALTESLLESELFGHERGAFTGAQERKRGLLEVADGGTLLLDEIGEFPLLLQPRLLRVLQERKFRRVGGTAEIETDVRIVAATNRELPAMIAAGAFREDLYYRLNVVTLEAPPLRRRSEDIPLLARHFLQRFGGELGRRISAIAPEVIEILQAHAYSGRKRDRQGTRRQNHP